MSWAHATPTEIVAVFAQGALFGALFHHLTKDAATRLSRWLTLRRRAVRAARRWRRLRTQNPDLTVEPASLRSMIDPAALALRDCESVRRFASNDDGSVRLGGRL